MVQLLPLSDLHLGIEEDTGKVFASVTPDQQTIFIWAFAHDAHFKCLVVWKEVKR